MTPFQPLPAADELRRLFAYDPFTGALAWRVRPWRRSRVRPGDAAGTLHHSGYVQVGIDGVIYVAHRLIFKHVEGREPTEEIDHQNGVRSDNRWANLREATRTEQGANKTTPNFHRGVHYISRSDRFGAQIKALGVHRWLGLYDTPEAACAVYRAEQTRLYGEFAKRGPCGCS